MDAQGPLIITRPSSDAARFIAAARACGRRVISMPVISIRFFDEATIDARPWQAVAFTSANGARAIARHPMRSALIEAVALSVGPASTRAALAAGFMHVMQAEGDVRALIEMASERLDPQAGPILYASGAITRGALENELGARGFRVCRTVLYEARPAQRLGKDAADALSGQPGAVALYSPRSARIWGRLTRDAGLAEAAGRWRYACLSRNVATALREALPTAQDVMVASAPREEALLRLLKLV